MVTTDQPEDMAEILGDVIDLAEHVAQTVSDEAIEGGLARILMEEET